MRDFLNRSFRTKLLVSFLLIGMVPLLLCTVLMLAIFQSSLHRSVADTAQTQLDALCGDLDGLLDELYTVADCGCGVLDVTVEHPVYGQLSGQLQVFSRYDADVFWDALQKNGAQPLCSLTGDIHLHTLVCPDEARKARVLAALEEKGYLMGLEK